MAGRRSSAPALAWLLIPWVIVAGCGLSPLDAADEPEDAVAMELTPLPAPQLEGRLSLEQTLRERRSVRSFQRTPLSPAEIGQLLWATQGVTNPRGYRTAPSAGALYPLEVYIVDRQGVYHYLPKEHSLETVVQGDRKRALFDAALRQEAVLEAPLVIVIAADYRRTEGKYGEGRTPRYVHLEAGHAAQNALLQAVSLDLGAVPVGAFHDRQVQAVLGLPVNQQPLYLIPVGHP